MPYPYDINVTANNLYEITYEANLALNGSLGIAILLTLYISALIIMFNRYRLIESFIASSFGAIIISIIMWSIGLLTVSTLQIVIIIMAIIIITAFGIDRR